jgi:hypothetical protein
VSFQHTTRTTMTNQSLKQANVTRTHSIPIAPKHDHSNTMNYVWDLSFSISDGHQLKIKSPHFSSKAHTFRNDESNRKANKPRNHRCLVVSTKVSQALRSGSSNNKAQGPKDCSQSTNRIINTPLHHQVQVKISSA